MDRGDESLGGATLTNKSITTILYEEEAAGRLVRFVPEMDHDETDVRELYLAANVHEFVRGNTEKHKNKAYFQRIRAALGEYVKGEIINDDDETLKNLKHLYGDRTLAYEWEFKITFHPAARIFGFFAKRNCLVLFVPELRSKLQTEDFRWAMEKNRDRWVAMFGNISPIKSGVLADCMDNFKC